MAVYGSLREGEYNYRQGQGEKLATETLEGYEMFSIGGHYPCITEGEGSVIVELYEPNEPTYRGIRGMEIGAGYEEKEIDTSLGRAVVYVMPRERINERTYPRVESGDWSAYLDQTRTLSVQ